LTEDLAARESVPAAMFFSLPGPWREEVHGAAARGAGGGIDDGGPRLGARDFDDGIDQDAGSEVLAGAGLGVLGVPFEQALVDIALHVGAEGAPGFSYR
jgi:hypothetical protein